MDNENSLNPMFRNNFTVFSSALEYIEEHLCDDLRQEDIAAECMYSLSSLQKIWKYCTGMSLKEYITKRRLTAAGRELTETSAPVLDIAVKYGYNSHEAFYPCLHQGVGDNSVALPKGMEGELRSLPKTQPKLL